MVWNNSTGIKSFETAAAYLERGRCKDDRPLPGKSTRLQYRANGDIAVKYHKTDVVTYKPNGDIILNSGGYRTMTTKSRMNEYVPYFIGDACLHVYQQDSVWYMGRWAGGRLLFQDGITIHPDGNISGAGNLGDVKKIQKLKKRIRKYARDFIDALVASDVPPPSLGDCWYCTLRPAVVEDVQVSPYKGKSASEFYDGGSVPMGEAFGDTDHLTSHMGDKYYVPSLLTRAMEVIPTSNSMQWALRDAWAPDANPDKLWLNVEQYRLYKVLYRYMYRQFGIAS